MLSILIPTYNYDITPLVQELKKQCENCKIIFEILAYDDGSNSKINKKNKSINELNNCTFKILPKNIGRSAIRNLLAQSAKYNSLLFIDAGTYPQNKNFIKNYILNINSCVLVGGMIALEKPPNKPFKLRWLVTKRKESKKGLHSCNFLIKRDIFINNPFNESLKNYGYEDVAFFDNLKKKHFVINRLVNPVYHIPDDNANSFIKKNELAIKNLIYLINCKKLSKNKTDVSKYYYLLNKYKLDKFISKFFLLTRPILKLNFNSSYPSLILFDFYKLGYFCLQKSIK